MEEVGHAENDEALVKARKGYGNMEVWDVRFQKQGMTMF